MAADPGRWPEPYLQPDRNQDCGYYAAAYLARCLGHAEVTADQVRAWREATGKHEAHYAKDALGLKMRAFWDYRRPHDPDDDISYGQKIFWLGQDYKAKFFVRALLQDGWIAHACVHRIAAMQHAVVVLGADDAGVLLMDPIHGHVTEPWEWFLGPGPGNGAHFIEGWYRRAGEG